MELGAFSVSLPVKDLEKSRDFYEKLGFSVFGGELAHNYLIMKSGTTLIGLFQGMIDRSTLTFNPGWDTDAQTLESYPDVRELQKKFKASGLTPEPEADESATGPGYFILVDPDGNPILFDQHV
jgi:catechol 2,3-dioxygenase-like lactoylglutathione lyase family enzyme